MRRSLALALAGVLVASAQTALAEEGDAPACDGGSAIVLGLTFCDDADRMADAVFQAKHDPRISDIYLITGGESDLGGFRGVWEVTPGAEVNWALFIGPRPVAVVLSMPIREDETPKESVAAAILMAIGQARFGSGPNAAFEWSDGEVVGRFGHNSDKRMILLEIVHRGNKSAAEAVPSERGSE